VVVLTLIRQRERDGESTHEKKHKASQTVSRKRNLLAAVVVVEKEKNLEAFYRLLPN
jgi:hypothetical protein